MAGKIVGQRQSIDANTLARLPRFAKYLGEDPRLANLQGIAIPTVDVEKVVPIGERENVWVDDGETAWRPWQNVYVADVDAEGNVVLDNWQENPLPTPQSPTAMSAGELGAYCFSDADLDRMAQEILGERWVPDRPGPSDARRALFDRVMAFTGELA